MVNIVQQANKLEFKKCENTIYPILENDFVITSDYQFFLCCTWKRFDGEMYGTL